MPFCSQCGGEVTQGARFCRHCGGTLVLPSTGSGPPGKGASNSGGKRVLKWVGIGCGGFLAVFILTIIIGILVAPEPEDSIVPDASPIMSPSTPLIEGETHEFTGSGLVTTGEFEIQEGYVCVYARGKYDIFTVSAYKAFSVAESYQIDLLHGYFPENDSFRGSCTLVNGSGFPAGTYAFRISTYDETPWQLLVCASKVKLNKICP